MTSAARLDWRPVIRTKLSAIESYNECLVESVRPLDAVNSFHGSPFAIENVCHGVNGQFSRPFDLRLLMCIGFFVEAVRAVSCLRWELKGVLFCG